MNRINVIGNVVKEVNLRFAPNTGSGIANITLAINEGYGEHKTTTFVDVTVFGKQAVNCAKYLKVGSRIGVSGSLRQNIWTDKEGKKHYDYYILADTFNGIEFISNIISKELNKELNSDNTQNDFDTTPVDDGDMPF